MNKRDLLTLLTSIIFSLAILEVGLRLFTPYPVNQVSNRVYHNDLGYVLSPDMREIDEHGFRNNPLPSIDVVAIGDSHTYGINVRSDGAWPKQLGYKLKQNVYNFGVGGYGVLHYQYLLEKSIEMQPGVILLGLYLTNDLNDICKGRVSKSQYWKSRAKAYNFDRSICPETDNVGRGSRVATRKTKRDILWSWLTENVAITSIASRYYSDYDALKIIEKGDIENGIVVNDGKIKTVLGIERIKAHASYIDMSRPHVQAAKEVLKKILTEAKNNAKAKNIRFGVLFIPSKERVLFNYLTQMEYELPEVYGELVKNEDALKDDISVFLNKAEIPFIDVLPGMEKALLKYGNIYPANDNGHPIETGYKIYAESAFDLYQSINK